MLPECIIKFQNMRPVTDKTVQVHEVCMCGAGSVYQGSYPVKWRDFSKAGITRKTDRKTGSKFLLMRIYYDKCTCHE
jgi:hypothetical protein